MQNGIFRRKQHSSKLSRYGQLGSAPRNRISAPLAPLAHLAQISSRFCASNEKPQVSLSTTLSPLGQRAPGPPRPCWWRRGTLARAPQPPGLISPPGGRWSRAAPPQAKGRRGVHPKMKIPARTPDRGLGPGSRANMVACRGILVRRTKTRCLLAEEYWVFQHV